MTGWAVGIALLVARAAVAQTFETRRPDTAAVTVGDPVSLRLILRQYEGDALLEQVPHPETALADGVRLLAVDSMRRVGDRLLEGRALIAFYRPGPQIIPAFAIDFRRGAVILHGTMRSDPLPIDVVPVLTDGGGPTLRDIRELVAVSGPDPRLVAALAVLLAVSAWALRRGRGRRAPVLAPALAVVDVGPAPAPDPFALALDRLAEIEASQWAAAGEVARHYEAVADALRDYLAAAAGIPARERTTAELLWMLPAPLADGGLRLRHESLFDEADLVKFARRRPDPGSATAYLAQARELLARWRDAMTRADSAGVEALDAVR
jgi:hypothetical protein